MTVRDTDKGFAALLKRLSAATQPSELTVGIHEAEGSEPKESGDDGEASDMTLAEIMTLHEFGLGGQERRSFINDWADENEDKHKAQLAAMAKAVVSGKVESVEKGLERLGSLYTGEVQKRLADGITPDIKQSTKDKKGSDKPLIDSGQARTAIAPYLNGKKIGGE